MLVQLRLAADMAAVRKSLRKNGEQWAKSMDYTMRDMRSRAPAAVARAASKTYNIAQSRLNPKNKSSSGSVSFSGGLTELKLIYRGPRLSVIDFKGVKPKSISKPRKYGYRIKGEIVRGQQSQIGHWNRPGSEGGRYGSKSPWMLVPGVTGPVMRIGGRLGGTMKALSVPQMVASDRHADAVIAELNDLMDTRLRHHLSRFGVS